MEVHFCKEKKENGRKVMYNKNNKIMIWHIESKSNFLLYIS